MRYPSWADRARCRGLDPELFFPAGKTGDAALQADAAKDVCRGCEVRWECLDYALEAKLEFGIFGGCDEDERKALVVRRRLASV